jgi:holo-[acyl-carrier protein] synthase
MSFLDQPPVAERGEVVGIGIDMVELEEVRHNIDTLGDRYLHRVFTQGELGRCRHHQDPVPQLATVFAAKEATLKALRTEGAQPPWTSIEVLHRGGESTEVRLSGAAIELAHSRRVELVTVSTTCDSQKAAAVAVATGPVG